MKNKSSVLWKLNTSNRGKLQEFQRLFALYGHRLEATSQDLKEIAADHVSVVVHKASQMEDNVLVEDTSLEIEGADVGVNVRWLLEHLSSYVGRPAIWTVLLAYREGNEVCIYQGQVRGVIVAPRGQGGFGFDPLFLPDGASLTLAEAKPDEVNARALVVQHLLEGQFWLKKPIMQSWEGSWQEG